MATKYWIGRAIKHRGSLKKWARKHHFTNQDGTINLNEAEAYARRHGLTHRVKQIEFVRRLKSFA